MLKLYETRSREVLPIEGTDGALKVYCCGPTVYRDAHVGNLRTFLLSDLISRAAALSGLNVTLIQNITDVGHMANDLEDKILAQSKSEALDPFTIARKYEERFHLDLQRLNIQPANSYPRASEHIALMISAIEKLILYFLCHNVIRLLTIRTQTSAGRADYDSNKVKLEFAIDIPSQLITVTGILPADPEVDLNTDLARKDHDYQLGRRVNPPRRILEQVLSKIGGTLMWETRGEVTYLVMRVPMRFAQITN